METIPDKLKEAVLLLDQTSCGIGLFDRETHETVFLNAAFSSITGYSQKEFSEIIDSGQRKLFDTRDKAAMQRLMHADNEKPGLQDFECRIICKDNEIKWVLFNLSETEAGDRTYYLASMIDKTECRKKNEILELISENTVASITIFSMSGQTEKLIFSNDCFFKLTGIGRRMYEKYYHAYNDSMISKIDRDRMYEVIQDSLKTNESQPFSYQIFLPNRKTLWIDSRLSAIQMTPDTVWIVAVSLDSSEKEKKN